MQLQARSRHMKMTTTSVDHGTKGFRTLQARPRHKKDHGTGSFRTLQARSRHKKMTTTTCKSITQQLLFYRTLQHVHVLVRHYSCCIKHTLSQEYDSRWKQNNLTDKHFPDLLHRQNPQTNRDPWLRTLQRPVSHWKCNHRRMGNHQRRTGVVQCLWSSQSLS